MYLTRVIIAFVLLKKRTKNLFSFKKKRSETRIAILNLMSFIQSDIDLGVIIIFEVNNHLLEIIELK
jgi:hypothetical protein